MKFFLFVNMITLLTASHAKNLRFPASLPAIDSEVYVMPSEEEKHEGTWLQWPHNYGWDPRHIQRYQEAWIQMTQALHTGERVHIIVYNQSELIRVRKVLTKRGLDMSKIDFWEYPTNDVWVRDNGPIFVRDKNSNLVIENWKFNGWGGKADFFDDDDIPIDVARDLGLQRIDVPMTNEGGSIELDGNGTLMAKKSSIINKNRNPGLTQAKVESFFRKYLGVTNFIWLEGQRGLDITDDHIDGTARFANANTIVTTKRDDFVNPSEYDVLVSARNSQGKPYKLVHLPITLKTILNTGYEGIYVNYYVGNNVVIVPTYNDPMDKEALRIIGGVYPTRRIVGVNMEELYSDGGAAHCVTQQQPVAVHRRRV
jgi:agmatine deiminase